MGHAGSCGCAVLGEGAGAECGAWVSVSPVLTLIGA